MLPDREGILACMATCNRHIAVIPAAHCLARQTAQYNSHAYLTRTSLQPLTRHQEVALGPLADCHSAETGANSYQGDQHIGWICVQWPPAAVQLDTLYDGTGLRHEVCASDLAATWLCYAGQNFSAVRLDECALMKRADLV